MVPRCSEPAAASDGACGEDQTPFGTAREAELGGEGIPSSLSKSGSLSLSAAVICKMTGRKHGSAESG